MATDSNIPEDWAEQARYDLGSAQALLDGGRYLHVVFFCQQAVEKALKALILERTGKLSPRTHNLPRLVKLANVALDESQADFIGKLSLNYMRTRYPEQIGSEPTQELAETSLKTAEEITEWLLSMLK